VARISKRKRKQDIFGVVIIVAVFVLAVVGGGLAFRSLSNKPTIDPLSFCSSDGYSQHVVLLIDVTDAFVKLQLIALQTKLDQVLNGLNVHDRFSLFFVGEDVEAATDPVFSLCNPGSGANFAMTDDNPRLREKVFQNSFRAPINLSIDQLLGNKEQNSSPIIEMLRVVSVVGFKGDGDEVEKRLILISDLIQNTPGFSRYKSGYEAKSFVTSKYYQRNLTNLTGIELDLVYVSRKGFEQMQMKSDAEFWHKIIDKMGGKVSSVTWLDR
jgi:hypothetical protein